MKGDYNMTEMEWRREFKFMLRRTYKAKGYRNQKEFAELVGISEKTISRIMNCTITASPNMVRMFADKLHCDVADIAPLEYIKTVRL